VSTRRSQVALPKRWLAQCSSHRPANPEQTFGRVKSLISTKDRIKLETILDAIQKNSQLVPTEYGVVVPAKLVLKTFPKESVNPTPARQERTGSRSLEDGILAHLREAREPATTQA